MKVRVIIGLLTFSMFFMYQLNRMNISICIVAIAKEELANNNTTWDSKPFVFGAFFYACWITELIGGFLFAKFGCRLVMAVAFSLNAIASFLFPIAYWTHPLLGFFVRVTQGISLGCTFPAMAWLSSKWIPKNERARFMSAFHGATLGASFTNLVGGIIIHELGWEYVFYLTGILCIIWVMLWWPFAYDSPNMHPRISQEELDYLNANVEANSTTTRKVSQPVPWSDIFTSIPFWATTLLFCCLMWMSLTLMQMPTYFDSVHALNIKTNGLLLSIPDLVKLYVGIQFPMVLDKFIINKKIKVSTARKLSVGLGYFVPGFLMMLLAFFGNYHPAVAGVIIIISVALNGAGASSLLASIVDISPNYAGTLMGIVKTIANLPAVSCPIIVKYILSDGDPANWRTVFLITAVLLLVNTSIYLIFSSTEIQPWNNKEISINKDENLDLMEKNKKVQIVSAKKSEL